MHKWTMTSSSCTCLHVAFSALLTTQVVLSAVVYPNEDASGESQYFNEPGEPYFIDHSNDYLHYYNPSPYDSIKNNNQHILDPEVVKEDNNATFDEPAELSENTNGTQSTEGDSETVSSDESKESAEEKDDSEETSEESKPDASKSFLGDFFNYIKGNGRRSDEDANKIAEIKQEYNDPSGMNNNGNMMQQQPTGFYQGFDDMYGYPNGDAVTGTRKFYRRAIYDEDEEFYEDNDIPDDEDIDEESEDDVDTEDEEEEEEELVIDVKKEKKDKRGRDLRGEVDHMLDEIDDKTLEAFTEFINTMIAKPIKHPNATNGQSRSLINNGQALNVSTVTRDNKTQIIIETNRSRASPLLNRLVSSYNKNNLHRDLEEEGGSANEGRTARQTHHHQYTYPDDQHFVHVREDEGKHDGDEEEYDHSYRNQYRQFVKDNFKKDSRTLEQTDDEYNPNYNYQNMKKLQKAHDQSRNREDPVVIIKVKNLDENGDPKPEPSTRTKYKRDLERVMSSSQVPTDENKNASLSLENDKEPQTGKTYIIETLSINSGPYFTSQSYQSGPEGVANLHKINDIIAHEDKIKDRIEVIPDSVIAYLVDNFLHHAPQNVSNVAYEKGTSVNVFGNETPNSKQKRDLRSIGESDGTENIISALENMIACQLARTPETRDKNLSESERRRVYKDVISKVLGDISDDKIVQKIVENFESLPKNGKECKCFALQGKENTMHVPCVQHQANDDFDKTFINIKNLNIFYEFGDSGQHSVNVPNKKVIYNTQCPKGHPFTSKCIENSATFHRSTCNEFEKPKYIQSEAPNFTKEKNIKTFNDNRFDLHQHDVTDENKVPNKREDTNDENESIEATDASDNADAHHDTSELHVEEPSSLANDDTAEDSTEDLENTERHRTTDTVHDENFDEHAETLDGHLDELKKSEEDFHEDSSDGTHNEHSECEDTEHAHDDEKETVPEDVSTEENNGHAEENVEHDSETDRETATDERTHHHVDSSEVSAEDTDGDSVPKETSHEEEDEKLSHNDEHIHEDEIVDDFDTKQPLTSEEDPLIHQASEQNLSYHDDSTNDQEPMTQNHEKTEEEIPSEETTHDLEDSSLKRTPLDEEAENSGEEINIDNSDDLLHSENTHEDNDTVSSEEDVGNVDEEISSHSCPETEHLKTHDAHEEEASLTQDSLESIPEHTERESEERSETITLPEDVEGTVVDSDANEGEKEEAGESNDGKTSKKEVLLEERVREQTDLVSNIGNDVHMVDVEEPNIESIENLPNEDEHQIITEENVSEDEQTHEEQGDRPEARGISAEEEEKSLSHQSDEDFEHVNMKYKSMTYHTEDTSSVDQEHATADQENVNESEKNTTRRRKNRRNKKRKMKTKVIEGQDLIEDERLRHDHETHADDIYCTAGEHKIDENDEIHTTVSNPESIESVHKETQNEEDLQEISSPIDDNVEEVQEESKIHTVIESAEDAEGHKEPLKTAHEKVVDECHVDESSQESSSEDIEAKHIPQNDDDANNSDFENASDEDLANENDDVDEVEDDEGLHEEDRKAEEEAREEQEEAEEIMNQGKERTSEESLEDKSATQEPDQFKTDVEKAADLSDEHFKQEEEDSEQKRTAKSANEDLYENEENDVNSEEHKASHSDTENSDLNENDEYVKKSDVESLILEILESKPQPHHTIRHNTMFHNRPDKKYKELVNDIASYFAKKNITSGDDICVYEEYGSKRGDDDVIILSGTKLYKNGVPKKDGKNFNLILKKPYDTKKRLEVESSDEIPKRPHKVSLFDESKTKQKQRKEA